MQAKEARERQSSGHVENETYKNDVDFALQLSRYPLTILGTWPMTSEVSNMKRVRSNISIAICYLLQGFLIVPCCLHTFVEEKDNELRLKTFGPLNFCIATLMKYCLLISHEEDITYCIEFVKSDWHNIKFHEDWKIMTRNVRIGRYITILCFIFINMAGLFYNLILPLSLGEVSMNGNVSARSLGFPGYYVFFDVHLTPVYEIVFLLHLICASVLHLITNGIYALLIMFVMHACGQLQIITLHLENLVNGSGRKFGTLEERLALIVEHHLRIFRFSAYVEKAMNQIWLIEVVSCTLNICFAGHYLMTEWKHSEPIGIITYVNTLICFTFNILVLCYVGEILMEQSKKIGIVAYMTEWYHLPKSKALDLMLIIGISNRGIKITAGKLIELTLENFCGILQTSVTYFNMLRTITT